MGNPLGPIMRMSYSVTYERYASLTYLIPGCPDMMAKLGLVHEIAFNERDDFRW